MQLTKREMLSFLEKQKNDEIGCAQSDFLFIEGNIEIFPTLTSLEQKKLLNEKCFVSFTKKITRF